MILSAIDEAVTAGARQSEACALLGLSDRTLQRWRLRPDGDDQRRGPRHAPANALSPKEQDQVLTVMTSERFSCVSPKQLVPALADEGLYLASESTLYRLRRRFGLAIKRRSISRTNVSRASLVHKAVRANEVWSWDITYLPTLVGGRYFYLYLMMDVWSRRIVAFEVHERESSELAADLFVRTCEAACLDPLGMVLHSDNGNPMRGHTMVATLQSLGVIPSFSRPHVSNDNAYSESLFRTLKYTPAYPKFPFASLEAARRWVASFVNWYNSEHRHSGIRFVTPDERHFGDEARILARRHALYQRARSATPERWSRATRNWSPVGEVVLNPEPQQRAV